TRVSVAHRPAVVRAADRVFEVFEGRVAELPPRARVTRQKAHLALLENSPGPRAGAGAVSSVG
ncbi:MAG TPA: hypothetical protein VG963_24545, partial [Polyangiaceae bacterium]|nr:hypothetical protein [Polyangiaceae bacterium]